MLGYVLGIKFWKCNFLDYPYHYAAHNVMIDPNIASDVILNLKILLEYVASKVML